jgi:hypothetical protein
MQNVDVAQDSRIASLTGTAYTGPTVATVTPTAPRAPVETSNTTPAASAETVSVSATDSRYFNLATAGWSHNLGPKSNVNSAVIKENIRGLEKEVLSINGTFPSGSGWILVESFNRPIAQKLANGSGIRLKALGDGKTWQLLLITNRTDKEQISYRGSIATKKDSIVEIDISYSKLRQPSYEKKIGFNKNSILGFGFERNQETYGGVGASSIKIFDIEVY